MAVDSGNLRVRDIEKRGALYMAVIEEGQTRYRAQASLRVAALADCTCGGCDAQNQCRHVKALLDALQAPERTALWERGSQMEAGKELLAAFEPPPLKEECLQMRLQLVPGLENAQLMLRIGQSRLYVVSDMADFLSRFRAGQAMTFGRGFKIDSSWQRFSPWQENMLEIIWDLIRARELATGAQARRLRAITLTEGELKRVMEGMGRHSFDILIDGVRQEAALTAEEFPVSFALRGQGDQIELEAELPDDLTPLSRECAFVAGEITVYELDAYRRRVLRPFLLNEDKRLCLFSGRESEKLLTEILPQLRGVAPVHMDDKLSRRVINLPLQTRAMLDYASGSLLLQLRFQYGEQEFDPFGGETRAANGRIVMRDLPAERAVLDLIGQYQFRVRRGGAILSDDQDIGRFLEEGLPLLQTKAEAFCTEALLKVRPRTMQLGRKLGMRGGFLELSFDVEGMDLEDAKAILNALQTHKKYVKIKDGMFLALQEEQHWDELAPALQDGEATEDGTLRLKPGRAAYMAALLRQMPSDIEVDPEVEAMADRLMRPPEPENVPIEGMRPYQRQGLGWLQNLAALHLGGVLADDMGLGKTLQVLALLAHAKDTLGAAPSIVVAPTSLTYNWLAEVAKFTPSLKAVVLEGNPEERRAIGETINDVDVFIVSYAQVRRDISWIREYDFRYGILDEAQHIKNPSSVGASAVKQLKTQARFALTGTPMENHPGELWSLYDYVLPGYLPSYPAFMRRWGEGQDAESLRERIRPFLLRRLKSEVLRELPDKIETKMLADMTPQQKQVYLATLRTARDEMERSIQKQGWAKTQFGMLSQITRLRQLCCHPALYLEGYEGGSGKLDMLLELAESAAEAGHRMLVFSQFTSMLAIIQQSMKRLGLQTLYLDGDTPASERTKLCEQFNKGDMPVFLISLRAGGAGLNLTGADMVVHYDPWWNPAVEDQAADRAHRIGQEKVVQVVRLVARGSIEEKVCQLQWQKKMLIDRLITAGEVMPSQLTEDQVRALFSEDDFEA